MNRLILRMYILLIVVSILSVAGWILLRVYDSRQDAIAGSEQNFAALSVAIATLWQDGEQEEAAPVVAPFLNSQGAQTSPVAVVVTTVDQEDTDYLWARQDRYLEGMVIPGSTPRPTTSLPTYSYMRVARSFQMPDNSQRVITAVYPILSQQQVYPILQRALIAALVVAAAALVLAVVLVLANHHQRNFATVTVSSRPEEPRFTPVQESPLAAAMASEPPAVDVSPSSEDVSPSSEDAPASVAAPPPPENPTPRVDVPAERPADPPAEESRANVGADQSVLDQIGAELDRAAFMEQDMAVVVFEFSRVLQTISFREQRDRLLSTVFPKRELQFSLQDGKTLIIVPNTTIQGAIQQVEEFQKAYGNAFASETGEHEAPNFYAGLTGRAFRLVDSQRILKECYAALEQARTTRGRIVGFQPNPQRYRAFLAES